MQKLLVNVLALALALALAAPLSAAQEVAPDALLKMVTKEVIEIIRHDQGAMADDPAKIAALVETKILPHFDFTRMTQIALARNWLLTSVEQKVSLTMEFRALLVRTYSEVLSSYNGQSVEFKRLRAAPGDTEVTVRSVIRQPGMDSMAMNYEMEKVAAEWKVYDIKIDGISLITSYREAFSGKVREAGVDGLIKALADKNRQNDVRFRARQMENYLAPAILPRLLLGGR